MYEDTDTDRKERIEAAYRSWRCADMSILEASRYFTVEPDEIMDQFYRKEPFKAWWIHSKAESALLLTWLRSLLSGSRR